MIYIKEYHESRPLHTALRRRNPEGDKMLTYGQVFQQILANACPAWVDPENPHHKHFIIDLHCSEALIDVTFEAYSKEWDQYVYVIHSVEIGCESMTSGCEDCPTIKFDNLTREKE